MGKVVIHLLNVYGKLAQFCFRFFSVILLYAISKSNLEVLNELKYLMTLIKYQGPVLRISENG